MERFRLLSLICHRYRLLVAAGVLTLLCLYGLCPIRLQAQQDPSQYLMHLQADDSQWVMPAKNYASTRY